ncbi:MAG: rhodanese-like domain-containing protein [Pseudomonadota bacterium]
MHKFNEIRVITWLVIGSSLVLGAGIAHADTNDDPVTERLERRSEEVRAKYTDVRHVTPEQLLAMPGEPLLIDVREADEYGVSRLPNALHAPDRASLLALVEAAADRPVVVYCSLGVRSSEAARFLAKHGHDDVANLDGSIFRWANEGRPLVNDFGPTDRAHPYNLWWGRYLKRNLHEREPNIERR